ncbi:midasin-like isoform X2 [Argiope bruennichi]|uniref:midasin-like isoform X2 n=1 Tax=Argiope bruennichi TaxID=94029 RepID=UPI00249414B0|nr:midasin-like isoform X2 [Argiope bruennichi]
MEKWTISAALNLLADGDEYLTSLFSKYLNRQLWSNEESQEIINKLSNVLLNENYTTKVAELFSPVLLELLSQASSFLDGSADCYLRHEWLCICLSKLIWIYPEVGRFTRTYFEKKRQLFWRYENVEQPPNKKQKTSRGNVPQLYQLLKAGYLFLIYDASYFKGLWSWSIIVQFLKDSDVRARWYAHRCLGHVANIKDSNLYEIFEKHLSREEYAACAREAFEINTFWNRKSYDPRQMQLSYNFEPEIFSDVVRLTVNVCGVLLSKVNETEVTTDSKLVYVTSTSQVMKSLALAVSSSEPVLLQGPVGCGKTSLIQEIASLIGRRPVENFLKIQLGDHVDSKMLLGAHVCTDIPGQFVWKPGILIKAMTEGHWLLLEDIDCAPMDIISLLIPVLQSRSITLPGHPKPVKAAPGFQLFATKRFITGSYGCYLEVKKNADLIDKQWRKLIVKSLSDDELTQVICSKWPVLKIFTPQILSAFNKHLFDIKDAKTTHPPESMNNSCKFGRTLTLRDLLKYCNRIAENFNKTKDETKVNALRHAIDCLADNIPNPEHELRYIHYICDRFGLDRSKGDYFFHKHKPNIENSSDSVLIGQICLPKKPSEIKFTRVHASTFAHTRQALALLEKVATCVKHKEPVLLVGETGTGKTSIVQYLAELINQKLTVINMSQQSDSVDLVGGYKPVDLMYAIRPVKEEFEQLFPLTMNAKENAKFLGHIANCYSKKAYYKLSALMLYAQKNIVNLYVSKYMPHGKYLDLISQWEKLGEKIKHLQDQIKQGKPTLAFQFMEGALVKAMKNGEWLLLDEINLAEAETLECLVGVLEQDDSLILLEKGDNEPVKRHPDFRIFACMNPATDVGKKELPIGIRNRFTEFFVEEVSNETDLLILVHEYLKTLSVNNKVIENIVKFYKKIKIAASKTLNDGSGYRPHYSLRTLCRALRYASSNPCHNVPRSLYEAFCLSFLSQLDNPSHHYVTKAIQECLLGDRLSVLKQSIPEPGNGSFVQVAGYWILKGTQEPCEPENYIFTKTVQRNLHDLARIVSAGRFPVLLQGETSSGKTSLIQYLAKITGNVCLRVNNHEHTDIQEYVGTYGADASGKLVFREGILVEAMRKGYWIILDELNLAPTEVMEALNRVLDDNRELFISETQEVIKAQPGFMIFATQNPPGHYGGRKILSRAFRNRFIELHFNEIPPHELEVILEKRCKLSRSHSIKLVAVMHELQMRRRESGVFAGKQGFITLRDLFRWGERYNHAKPPVTGFYDWDQHLADEGYLLLAGKVRHPEEVLVIQDAILKHLKRKTNPETLFTLNGNTSVTTKHILQTILGTHLQPPLTNIVWTEHMRRLAVLVGKAMQFNEPVLLIGNTGCGKTTMCQIFAQMCGKELYSVNCHMHSESADFLGGLRPVRDVKERETKLFEWADGPLIKAMNEGSYFLCDEISLADDSVLERLNSVLEQEQKILLTEKNTDVSMNLEIKAKRGFHFFATMNPGGDYGKKELSPALRNRFTEIWCPSNISKKSDVIEIVEHNIRADLQPKEGRKSLNYGEKIANFLCFYSQLPFGKMATITVRDILTWVEFINVTAGKILPPLEAYLHGAILVFLDSIGSGPTAVNNPEFLIEIKKKCFKFLGSQSGRTFDINTVCLLMPDGTEAFTNVPIGMFKGGFGIEPFLIECVKQKGDQKKYILEARVTKANILRLLRAMRLPKPILLEGSPGVGKTSMVEALARASGHKLVRINLSEQTDVSDLFGADLPVEGGKMGEFAWRDGPLLQALKNGHWILLDELNLASQSVLEGLNACLDHRSEIYISELGLTFHVNKSSVRIFACQNPYQQGGSRKGLPRSFLNRFTQVYMTPMDSNDFFKIAHAMYPDIPKALLYAMIAFNNEIDSLVNKQKVWGLEGSPFEFNLRDIFRWCEAIVRSQMRGEYNIGEFVRLIYADRIRNPTDKSQVFLLYKHVMNAKGLSPEHFVMQRPLDLNVYEDSVQLGNASIKCVGRSVVDTNMTAVPSSHLPILESIMKCVEMNWMPILVGSSGSGKSSLVRLLAELCGQRLQILSVNSEMDTMELLGGFEQVDLNRKLELIDQDLEPVVRAAVLHCIHPSAIGHTTNRLDDILAHAHFLSNIQSNTSLKVIARRLLDLIDVLSELHIPRTKNVLSNCRKILNDLGKKINMGSSSTGGQFEWVDSVLIDAATRGHWLLVDDANFCSPSVLDRLNSLLEPNGVLTITEQGVVGKELRTITPHPDFRIFLTLDPRNGEISRAMRNRGVEIYVTPVNVDALQWRSLLNLGLLTQCKGLNHSAMTYHLYTLHNHMYEDMGSFSLCDFLSAVSLYVQLIQRNVDTKSAFIQAGLTVYMRYTGNGNSKLVTTEFIRRIAQKCPTLNKDLCLPLTSLLPTSIDYRHNSVCAAVKQHAFVFSYFMSHLKNLVRNVQEVDVQEAYFPYPVPTFSQKGEGVFKDRFFCIIRLMMESCSVQLFRLLDVWLQYYLEQEIQNETFFDVKQLMKMCLQLKNVLSEQLSDPIVLELIDVVANICDHCGFTEVKKSEISIDPRWKPNIYRKLIFKFKQNCVRGGNVNFDEEANMIDFKVSCCANKFSLLLLLRTMEFSHSFIGINPHLCSLVQTEKVSKLLEERKRNAVVVHNIHGFLENVPHILLGVLKKMDCPDDYYWKLRDILSSYYACRRVCEEPFAESAVYGQLLHFSTHFYWLWKKIKNIYESEEDIPSSLQNCFKAVDNCLSFKNKEIMFRSRFGKKSNYPLGFVHEKAAEAYCSALEVYKHISLLPRLKLKELNLNDIKVIVLNKRSWMSVLSSQVYESVFSSLLESVDHYQGVNKIKDIKLQLHEANLISEENDDIMEICQNPAEIPHISNEKLAAQIQLMPLLDYIFNIYTAEIFTQRTLDIDKRDIIIDTRILYGLGVEDICVNPKHLAHIFRYYIKDTDLKSDSFKEVDVLLMASFLIHIRQGFSSQGLNFLHSQLTAGSNGVTILTPEIEWNTRSIWSKQVPLLTYICASISECSCDTIECHSPLRKFEGKVEQLEFMKSILWNNYEKLTSPRHSVRSNIYHLVNLWFVNLVHGVAKTVNYKINDLTSIECLKKIFEEAGVSSLAVSANGTDVFTLAFNSFNELNAAIEENEDDSRLMWLSCKAYVYVGLLTVMLLLPRDAIDPSFRRTVKANYYESKVQEYITEEGIRNWMFQVLSGITLEEVTKCNCTPHLKNLFKEREETKKILYALNKKVVCRQDDMFEEIKDVLWACMRDICCPDNIINIMAQIDRIIHNTAPEKWSKEHDVLLRAQTLAESQRQFIEQNARKYWSYEDLTMPFYLGIEQIIYGLQLARQIFLLQEMDMQLFQNTHSQSITTFLSQFISFPVDIRYNPLDMAGLLLDTDNINSFKNLLSICKVSEIRAARCISKLLKSGVLEITNEIRMRPLCSDTVKHKVFTLLSSAMAFFWDAWNLQQIQIKQKKEEEESLYIHKEKHHEGELTEEEAIEKKIQDSFPSFRKAYSDCLGSNEDIEENPLENLAESLLLTPDDTFEIWQLHATVMSIMMHDGLKNADENMKWVLNKSKTLDFNTPYLLRYEVVCEIIKSIPDKMDGALDSQLIAGHLLMCNELQKIQQIGNQFYDIYHSPNPVETLTIKPILFKLENRLKILLKKHPEDPLLLQILKLVERVFSFPITDPLMKFVVGLELILESMQSWKDILKEERETISKKIIEYRSLELDGWKRGLDSVIRKQYVNCSKWWFHLYGLINNLTKDPEKKETCDTVIDALKQFLEDSPLGEFSARISLLHTFLQHTKLSQTLPSYRKLSELLFNLYCYYEQFLPNVNNRIAQIRKPIDKELKDFVKIARWNDINFDALKQSVKKSHSFVVKHVKTFEDALKVPAKEVFDIPSKADSEKIDGFSWTLDIKEINFISKSDELIKSEYFSQRDDELLQKMPHYYKRLSKFSKRLSKSFTVVNDVNILNELCGTIIESLQSVIVDSEKKMSTRSKEKKQGLLLIQKKKQLLSALFKNLKAIGLSFGHGRIFAKNVLRGSNILLTVPAFDCSQMEILKFDKSFKELLLKASQDTSHYFYKSLAQYALLQKHMELPCKDLTLDIIYRIDGYSGSLMYYIITQRQEMVQIAKNIDKIGCFLGSLSALQNTVIKNRCTVLPPENDVMHLEETLNNLNIRMMATIQQFGVLMNCAPRSFKCSFGEIPLVVKDPRLIGSLKKGDLNWTKMMTSIAECAKQLEKYFQQLLNSDPNFVGFATWERFSQIVENFEILATSVDIALSSMQEPLFNKNQQIVSSLTRLYNEVHEEFKNATAQYNLINFEARMRRSQKDDMRNKSVGSIIQKLTKEVLLAYQDIATLCATTDMDGSDDNICPENLLTTRIMTYLSNFEKYLRFKKVKKLVLKLKKHIQQYLSSIDDLKAIDDSLRLLLNLTPVLKQYFQLVKVFFATYLGMHRTSCKFLTILLDIFVILASKGFCIPPELQEEAQKSGDTKFEDIESGGLDEGEGVKDISENIETEDQLEDTLKEGQEKKEKEESDDIKNEEKGIEMSEDFEGKSYDPENTLDESETSDSEEEGEDLDKQMGDVEGEDSEKLDEKVWGSDSEDEDQEELNDANDTGGISENRPSELVAKDGLEKENNRDKSKLPEETLPEENNDEYQGNAPDPLIDAPPDQEPEVVELPDDMEITDDVDKDDGDNEPVDSEEITYNPDESLDSGDDSEEGNEPEESNEEDSEKNSNKLEEDNEGEMDTQNGASTEPASEEENETDDKKNESKFPTQTPTAEKEALPSADQAKSSSHDPVQEDTPMDWESGAHQADEQHEEGQANAQNEKSAAHEGVKSSSKQSAFKEQQQKRKLKPPAQNRTLDDNADNSTSKQRPIADKQSLQKSLGAEEDADDDADVYEHVSNKEEGVSEAVDVATEEQAAMRPAQMEDNEDSDSEDVIELSSDEEEEYYDTNESIRTQGDIIKNDTRQRPGERGNYDEEENGDTNPEGEVVRTHTVPRGETTIHTQYDLWASMSLKNMQERRQVMEKNLELLSRGSQVTFKDAVHLWKNYEDMVLNLAQELCEQLRLVLEPTKMSKLKGDYRTGKRLNMRKIIPYIASHFRKDKIWLRRTKASKRQYQIILAVDDSLSMADNHSKQLAFESLAVLGQSLTLLESGELCIVSFGEKVEPLHNFDEPFDTNTGARIVQQLTFCQKKTNYAQLLKYAIDVMVQNRNISSLLSKETAQLLVILSDGRGVNNEGKDTIVSAVREARDNNIFMVFIIIDSPKSKDSILDIQSTIFESKGKVTLKPYIDDFPFPFYIILRDISALPTTLGGALRQWFELVTATER